MRRIETRLRQLEAALKLRDGPICRGIACVMHGASLERRKNLAPGERVVKDWFRDSGGYVSGQYRITSDPADQGRRCKAGGYLLDVLEKVHKICSHRESMGSCLLCKDTPVAEERPTQPSSSDEG